jgi:hypothetical protein
MSKETTSEYDERYQLASNCSQASADPAADLAADRIYPANYGGLAPTYGTLPH